MAYVKLLAKPTGGTKPLNKVESSMSEPAHVLIGEDDNHVATVLADSPTSHSFRVAVTHNGLPLGEQMRP